MVIAILVVLGLALGSFINVLVYRFYVNQKSSKKKPKKQLSVLNGRSICPHCYHQLAWNDLVPVFSWLWLNGKCRYCHKPIHWQYPVVELLTALTFVVSYEKWPLVFNTKGTILFVFWLTFIVGLIALAIYDLRYMLLPNKVVYPLIGLGLIQAIILLVIGPIGKELALIISSVFVGGGFFYLIFQISSGKWIGGGDVKLGTLLGLILSDWQLTLFAIFVASLIGSLVSAPLLASGKLKKTSRIPFGPFLIVGTILARLFGRAAINWYIHRT